MKVYYNGKEVELTPIQRQRVRMALARGQRTIEINGKPHLLPKPEKDKVKK